MKKKYILYFLLWLFIWPSLGQKPTEVAKQGPLTEEEIIVLVKEKYKGTMMENFMESNPRLTLLTVRVTRDENIKELWKATLADKTRYYFFAGFFILTALINWYWRRRQIQTLAPIWQKVASFMARFTLVNGSRVGFFIFLFKTEITPVWAHVKNIFNF